MMIQSSPHKDAIHKPFADLRVYSPLAPFPVQALAT
jgi:hypothetical protein